MNAQQLFVGCGVAAFYVLPMTMVAVPNQPAPSSLIEAIPPRYVTIDLLLPTETAPTQEPPAPPVEAPVSLQPETPTQPLRVAVDREPVAIVTGDSVDVPVVRKKRKRRRRNRYARCTDNAGIQVSSNGFVIQRSVIDHYAHILRYRRLGHVSWHKGESGERDGFKLRRIHCDLHEAGIRNGDVINTVNGHTVQTIPQAIRLWFKVRRSKQIIVNLTRRGTPIRINYKLKSGPT